MAGNQNLGNDYYQIACIIALAELLNGPLPHDSNPGNDSDPFRRGIAGVSLKYHDAAPGVAHYGEHLQGKADLARSRQVPVR